MLKVELERIKPRYFTGYVYREHLPERLQRQFKGDTVEIEGAYSIEWGPNHEALPRIDGPLLLFQYEMVDGRRNMNFANLDSKTADFKAIEKEISETEHYHQWVCNSREDDLT